MCSAPPYVQVRGYGVQLHKEERRRELSFVSETKGYQLTNGAMSPWNAVYVRARGQPSGTAANTNSPLRCTDPQTCDTSGDKIKCRLDKQMQAVPTIINRQAVEVDLISNALTRVKQDDFGGMAELETLLLDQNMIVSIDEAALRGCVSLRRFEISKNALTEVPEGLFKEVVKLEEIFLSDNKLTTLPEKLFEDLGKSLTNLVTDSNPIQFYPPKLLSYAKSLTFIADVFNVGGHIDFAPEYFYLPKLRLIAIWHLSFSITPGIFAKVPALVRLRFAHTPRRRKRMGGGARLAVF